ncbi:32636_t:CDS:1, partial [Racocetra persica]
TISKYTKRVQKTRNTFASIIAGTALHIIAATALCITATTASYESRTTEITKVLAARESIRHEGDSIR